MKLNLTGKTAFIAGSSSGIGRACAFALAQEGCTVIISGRNREKLQRTQEDIASQTGSPVLSVTGDLDRASQIRRMLDEAISQFGPINILIANNGGPPTGTPLALSEESYLHAWERTFMSTIRLVNGCIPSMLEQRWGRIITITSISVRQPVPDLALSNAYRSATTAWMKSLSDEVAASGITVNMIAPGYIRTDRLRELILKRAEQSGSSENDVADEMSKAIPIGKLGKPEDVSNLVAFLSSELAEYITGVTILVDGGLYRGMP